MRDTIRTVVVQQGVGLGTVIAVVVSWHRSRSVLWAIFHGICSWLYVVYFVLTERRKPEERAGGVGLLGICIALVLIAFAGFFLVAQFVK